MKICQINCIYGSGSTGKIVRDIHITLKKEGIESIVIAPLKVNTRQMGVFIAQQINSFLLLLPLSVDIWAFNMEVPMFKQTDL